MGDSWYYAYDGARKGPVSREDLRQALIQGEIERHSLVWCEGMPQWQALESLEELQSLVEQVPPPLPPEPPPLPSEPPQQPSAPFAAAPSDAVGPGERSDGEDQRPRAGRQRNGKAKKLGAGLVGWLAEVLGDALKQWLLGRPVTSLLAVSVLVVVVVYAVKNPPPKPELPQVSGRVLIDANPWGQVEWIHGPRGVDVDLPAGRTTPLVMSLPVGSYQARVDYPHARASERCEFQVQPDELVTCRLVLAPVDAKSYFQKIGW
jgi:GYF domain 2